MFQDQRIQVRNKDGRPAMYECCVLGSAVVVADDPSQHLASLNWTAVTYEWARDRRLLRPILMRTGGVVVVDELVHHPLQMILAENHSVDPI